MYWSSSCRTTFANTGEITDPCGGPLQVAYQCHSSRYPALRNRRMSSISRSSAMRFRNNVNNTPMINCVEVAFEIPFEYPRWRPAQKNRLERRVATSLGTKAVRARAEQWLIQGFQDE